MTDIARLAEMLRDIIGDDGSASAPKQRKGSTKRRASRSAPEFKPRVQSIIDAYGSVPYVDGVRPGDRAQAQVRAILAEDPSKDDLVDAIIDVSRRHAQLGWGKAYRRMVPVIAMALGDVIGR